MYNNFGKDVIFYYCRPLDVSSSRTTSLLSSMCLWRIGPWYTCQVFRFPYSKRSYAFIKVALVFYASTTLWQLAVREVTTTILVVRVKIYNQEILSNIISYEIKYVHHTDHNYESSAYCSAIGSKKVYNVTDLSRRYCYKCVLLYYTLHRRIHFMKKKGSKWLNSRCYVAIPVQFCTFIINVITVIKTVDSLKIYLNTFIYFLNFHSYKMILNPLCTSTCYTCIYVHNA